MDSFFLGTKRLAVYLRLDNMEAVRVMERVKVHTAIEVHGFLSR